MHAGKGRQAVGLIAGYRTDVNECRITAHRCRLITRCISAPPRSFRRLRRLDDAIHGPSGAVYDSSGRHVSLSSRQKPARLVALLAPCMHWEYTYTAVSRKTSMTDQRTWLQPFSTSSPVVVAGSIPQAWHPVAQRSGPARPGRWSDHHHRTCHLVGRMSATTATRMRTVGVYTKYGSAQFFFMLIIYAIKTCIWSACRQFIHSFIY